MMSGRGDISLAGTMGGRSLLDGRTVRIYLCGVTVYDRSHIGHARTVIVFDAMRRYLESCGKKVVLVQNFTDIDDKIIERAKSHGISAEELASKYVKEYYEGFDALGVIRASEHPLATRHIAEIISFIKDLEKGGYAYGTENGAYFEVSKFAKYGRLSGKNTDELQAGARVQVDEKKRSPLDFALWKASSEEPSWESPWGRGRPGWHIECSAMALKYLGEAFDVHGGGRDLIFPHHENEIAQSESRSGAQMAKAWMHVGMVTIDGQKMSKSLGNVVAVSSLLESRSPAAVRLFCLATHYSKPVDYTDALLDEHEAAWARARLARHLIVQHLPGSAGAGEASKKAAEALEAFDQAMCDDLNTHAALSALHGLASHCIGLGSDLDEGAAGHLGPAFDYMAGALGLQVRLPAPEERAEIGRIISERAALRAAKRFAEADALRDGLSARKISLNDISGRTVWVAEE